MDIVRVYLYASYPHNYDPADEELVRKQAAFFDRLKEEYHYEVELFPIDFRGRRIRYADREPSDDFEPKEKCVDIALATSLLYYAAIPYAYDVGVVIVGDRDYLPVLQHVRRLGKRVAIASVKQSCAGEYSDPQDAARVKDTDIIWLDDLIPQLELRYERHQLQCQSPYHVGDRNFWTTYHPKKGERVYCDDCRRKYAEMQAQGATQQPANRAAPESQPPPDGTDQTAETPPPGSASDAQANGQIERIFSDRGFGFIQGDDGKQYYFHMTYLENAEWNDLSIGTPVKFRVQVNPDPGEADRAVDVRVLDTVGEEEPEHAGDDGESTGGSAEWLS